MNVAHAQAGNSRNPPRLAAAEARKSNTASSAHPAMVTGIMMTSATTTESSASTAPAIAAQTRYSAQVSAVFRACAACLRRNGVRPVSYTHLTLPTTPYV